MDFGSIPPEINSARMYVGAGSAPMMAAASAWNGLGAELTSAASAYQSVISSLTGELWLGPASVAMATAVAPFVVWLNGTAAAAEHAATQATSSAAAYEAAFAMTVPPPLIVANRAQLAALVVTNVLGVNTAAIAATEALYAEMWAQDAAAMYGYAASSAAAGVLQPIAAPNPIANPTGPGIQAAGTAQATANAGAHAALTQVVNSLPSAVQALASPIAGSGQAVSVTDFTQNILGTAGNIGAWNMFAGISAAAGLASAHSAEGVIDGAAGAAALVSTAAPAAATATTTITVGITGGTPILASAGQAASVGGLSVPATWSATVPAPAAPATLAGAGWAAAADEVAPASVVPAGMPAMAAAGRGGYGFGTPRYGFRPTVMTRPVAAG